MKKLVEELLENNHIETGGFIIIMIFLSPFWFPMYLIGKIFSKIKGE